MAQEQAVKPIRLEFTPAALNEASAVLSNACRLALPEHPHAIASRATHATRADNLASLAA